MRHTKPTRDEVLNFNPDDWVFERGSGWAGYNKLGTTEWISEDHYFERLNSKKDYEKGYKLLYDFRLNHLPFGQYPDCVLQEFLNNKHFPDDNTKS